MSNPTGGESLTLPKTSKETLAALPMATLREYRNGLTEEEKKVSYWRRLVQFRLNLIKTQRESEEVSIRDLLKGLGATGGGRRRQQLLSVDAQSELPQLPGLDELWTSAINPDDVEGTQRLVEELNRVERQLSDYRAVLHDRIDSVTDELIERYRANPNLSLDLFPVNLR